MKIICTLLLILAFLPACSTNSSPTTKPYKVLYVTSLPGTYHDYVRQRELFLEFTKKASWDVTVLTGSYHNKRKRPHSPEIMAEIKAQKPLLELLKEKDYAKGYDAVVYNVCMALSNDVEAAHNIMQQTRENGVPAFLIHCSMHTFWPTFKYGKSSNWGHNYKGQAKAQKSLVDEWYKKHPNTPFPAWGDFTGFATGKHLHNSPITTKRLNNHPATRSVAKGYVTPATELYIPLYITPETYPLLEGTQSATLNKKAKAAKHDKNKAVIMWVTPQGKSKVMGLTIGHADADWQSAGFQNLVIDGVNWMIENPGAGVGK
jgi:hypothetical protein